MSDKKKFYPKRVIQNFGELSRDVGKWGLYCLPVVAIEMARKYWAGPGYWSSSYCESILSDTVYMAPSEEDLQPIFEMLDEALERSNMAFCEDILLELQGITSAINGLSLNCSCQSGGGGGCGGGGNSATIIAPTAESVSEGTPPDGMELIPVGDGGKCNRINYLIDNIASAVHDLNVYGATQAITSGVYILISLLAVVATQNPLMAYQVYKVMGYLEGIALFFSQQIDIDKIDAILSDDNVKKLLVCAWYEADEYDVVGGNAAMAAILSSEGFTTSELGLISAIGGVVAFSCIWYQETGSYSIYQEMTDYTGGVGCGDCAIGNVLWGYPGGLIEDYGLIEQAAIFAPNWGCGASAREVGIQFSRPVSVTDIDLISGELTPCSPSFLGYTAYLGGEEIYNSDEQPVLPLTCDQLYLLSGSDFTADVVIEEVV